MDYHDEVMVKWRDEVLGNIEAFCHSNILDATPPKFRYWVWYLLLGGGTVVALIASAALASQYNWISNLFGNVAAGLIASFVLLIFTSAKEKNLSYYESMTSELSQVVQTLEIAFNKLYLEERELRRDKRRFVIDNSQLPILENYRIFSMKVNLTHKMLLDVYKQVLFADKLDYKPLKAAASILDDHEREVENFERLIAMDYSKQVTQNFDEFDRAYLPLVRTELEFMRHLRNYVSEMQANINFVKFGRKPKD